MQKLNIRILVCILFICVSSAVIAQKQRQLHVDVLQEKGPHSKSFQMCVGAGRANEGLRADWQEQLRIVKNDCGFEYIRFHGLLHDDMGVFRYDKKGDPEYNWQYIDKLYDFILSIDMKPFVELSFMPNALKTNDNTVFWWKGNVSPPKSYEAYGELIYKLVKHLKDRYGDEEVATWYFEVWNEPNLKSFFSGTQEEYFKMYKTVAEAVKRVSKDYRVGGPATAGGQWVPETLQYCETNRVPLDFIATHTYGVKGFLDEFGENNLIMKSNPHEMWEKVQRTRGMIDNSVFKGIELHFTEWSSSYSNTDPVHDTYQNAPYILNTLKNSEHHATSMSYWTFTDVFEEGGVPRGPFHGGFGLLNLQNLKKPTYFVYKYLNQLGKIELENNDKQSWVCKSENEVQALVWDFTFLDQKRVSNRVFYKKNLPPASKSEVDFYVSNLENGTYMLRIYKTGYKHNDVYTSYYEMESPKNLSKKQMKILSESTSDAPLISKIVKVSNKSFKTNIEVFENDVFLIKLEKI
ncbi:glycoside hydrolase [Joostella atrarenae]|uniref:Glycoside hydrolase n=1 Tax=Joostella atrarenae TaxID=679257 RepID=A0ABS9J2N3_9FLAO|nr:glycoside hydrolase [Joostella atrarenae]MCF8714700.1 glycoside hydrolase [Joostella atrarenae]